MNLFGSTDEIQVYRESFVKTWEDDESIDRIRFVVLDSETTGLDPKKDSLVSIGAIVVQDNQILMEDQFEVILKVAYNSASVTIHGVTKEEADHEGIDEIEALKSFLGFLRDGIIVGHHIGFDVDIISQACKRRFGIELKNHWLDTMELTLHIDDAGLLQEEDGRKDFSLDGLCRRFNIVPHGRHTAPGDAFITAQIFLKLLRLAKKAGRSDLVSVLERYVDPNNPNG